MRGSSRCPSRRSASTDTRPARITAGSGSTSHPDTGPRGAAGTPARSSRDSSSGASGRVQSAPGPPARTVARRVAPSVRNGPHHTPASTRSPPTLIHSVCVPGGSAPWSMPGATLAPVAGTRRERDRTHDQGGDHDSGAMARLPALRRAGSTKHPRPGGGAVSFQGAGIVRRSPAAVPMPRPRSAAVAASAHRASGSRSTAMHVQACGRHGQGVAAGAAAEVGHGPDPGADEPLGVPGSHRGPGRLLQPVRRPPARWPGEATRRPGAQPRLGGRSGHDLGPIRPALLGPCAAEHGHGRAWVVGRERLHERPPLGRQQ